MAVYTVSQITQYLKESLEQDPLLVDLWISGEISNLRVAPSGHAYFTLKDAQSQLRSVMFKGGKGAELLSEGSLVTAHGRISFYEVRGDVQVVCDLVMPEGTGPLFLEYERLKMRLDEEGLFEPSRKRPLPDFPGVIGVVTSPSGAVLHDITNVIGRRYPLVEILLAPTLVQGDSAAPAIASALQALNEDGRADLIILARGGGSLEELWPFNEEIVARAIYSSRIPVVSAVGHERDYTVADYVADLRAPTPSAAAEVVVPDRTDLLQEVRGFQETILRSVSHHIGAKRQDVNSLARQLKGRAPDVDTLRRRVDDMAKAGSLALSSLLSRWQDRTVGAEMRLQSLHPVSILHRGYAIVQKQPDGQVVSSQTDVNVGEGISVRVSDGSFPATVGNGPRKPRSKKSFARAGARLL